VRAAEKGVDRFQREIDNETVRLLVVYSPVATDLRLLLMVTRINAELERIGDQAVNICRATGKIIESGTPEPVPEIAAMGEHVRGMLRDAMTAFADSNHELARSIAPRDEFVDELYTQAFKGLTGRIRERRREVSSSLREILIAKSLERIGDHAVNIAEDVVYIVQGEDIRHVQYV
jgi:phosphate transport system protein